MQALGDGTDNFIVVSSGRHISRDKPTSTHVSNHKSLNARGPHDWGFGFAKSQVSRTPEVATRGATARQALCSAACAELHIQVTITVSVANSERDRDPKPED